MSKVAGATASIVGGAIGITGFVLSFVTFGASLGLCIAGGVIAGAGGITVGGATVADALKSSDSGKKANAAIKELNTIKERLVRDCYEISKKLGDVVTHYPDWTQFWGKLMFGSAKIGWNLVYSVIVNTVRTGQRLADLTADIASGSVPAFRALTAAGQGFQIVGGVFGIIFLAVDFRTLVISLREIVDDERHALSAKIREAVKQLLDACPDEDEIENLLDEVGGAW